MAQIPRLIIANILLVIAYFVAGQFTLTLSLPPSGATPLWAPAGIALAAVLVWGYRLLPAVFIGDFLIAAYLFGLNDATSILLCMLFGSQALIHAWLGRWLLVRFNVWPSLLIHDSHIIKFFVLAGVVSSFFPAALTVVGELLLGVLNAQTWLDSLIIWWLGGALGVVVFAPITLILFASPRVAWRSRIVSVVVPMTILFIILVVVLHNARNNEQQQIQQHFDVQSQLVHALAEAKLDIHSQLLQATRAYFQNSDHVSEQQFNAYIQSFLDYRQDIYAIAWIEYIADEKRAAYENSQASPIVELDEFEQQFVPAKQRNGYYVVKYSQLPIEHVSLPGKRKDFVGFDFCAGVLRQSLCQRMALTKQPIIVDPIFAQFNPDAKNRFVYAWPVSNKQNDIMGMIAHVFDYEVLFGKLLSSNARQWVDLKITDKVDQSVLFSTMSHEEQRQVYSFSPLHSEMSVSVGSREWQFDYYPSQHFISTYSTWSFYWIITSALLVLSLIGAWLMTMSGRVQQVKKEVDDKTHEIRSTAKLLAESEASYRNLVENIKDKYVLYKHDRDGVFSYVSPSVEQLLGYSQAEFLQHYSTYMPDTENNQLVDGFTEQTLSGKTSSYEVDILDKNGQVHTLALTENPAYDSAGNIIGVEGIAQDITSYKNSRLQLEKLSLAIEHSPNAVVITDRTGKIEYVNPKFSAITGYAAEEAIGLWPDIVNSGKNPPELYKELWATVLSGNEWRGELQNRRKDGKLYWAQELIAPMLNEFGHVTHFVATQIDITEARRQSDETTYQASHDVLTGLINRREFEVRLDRVIALAKREQSEHALCFLDLDQFKIVNDTCGHIAGDELLRQVGGLLQTNVRSRDALARLGGDEFAILMEHCGIEQAYKACEQVIKLLEDFRFHWEEHIFTIGVSIGLTAMDHETADTNEALRHADGACYAAKDAGRNCVQVHTDDHERLQQRRGEIQWHSEITNALDEDRFLLYVQPVTPISNSHLGVGYEVLLRLKMPDGRIVAPGSFLPAAERYNSATLIDRWVVTQTLRWISRHADQLNQVSTISINLSGMSMGDEAMLGFIIREFEHGDVPAEKIRFEITETMAVANLRDAAVFIKTLKEFGCRFALDDFGSGLSSFAYLKNLQVDTLKIDGMFVKDMLHDSLDYEMVKSINEIGHVMGLETIAEFVESEDILDKLREIGVDYAQGYNMGKPMPIDNILQKLAEVV